VFDSWTDLIAALADLRAANNGTGCYTIMFDDSIVSPAVVSAGVYDMTNVTWSGDPNKLFTAVTVVEGVILNKLRRFTDRLGITFTGTTPPIADFTNAFEALGLDASTTIVCTGAGPFIRTSNAVGPSIVALRGGARIASGATQVIDVTLVGGVGLLIVGLDNAALESNTLRGVPGSGAQLLWAVSSASLSEDQPTFTGGGGTLLTANATVERRFPTPVITADTTIEPNVMALVDTTNNQVIITLPPAFNNRGVTVIVKDVGGNANVNLIPILPQPGDLIDGGPMGTAIGTPKTALTFVSNGVNDWIITATYP
jgi:hypothetical protein